MKRKEKRDKSKVLVPGRATVFSFLFALCSFLWPSSGHPTEAPPALDARAWLLMDHDSGQVLAEHDADRALAPASLTKLMVAYLVFEQLRAGKLKPGETVRVSARAGNTDGARLFLRPQTAAPLETLLQAMIVRSANDAAVALAEHLGGNEAAFVATMNAKARQLGLARTHFANVTGLDSRDGGRSGPSRPSRGITPSLEGRGRAAPGDRKDAGGRATPGAVAGTAAGAVAGTAAEDRAGHVSTARDLTQLASRLINDFPDYYRWFALREFTWQDIRQYNRNALLWRDSSVDGVKTGQTKAAGWCLIASAQRNRMRLIATVLGARDDNGRFDAGHKLLEYGFRRYETRLLYAAGVPAIRARVWLGDDSELPLGVGRNLYLTLPRGDHEKLRARLAAPDGLTAPIRCGQPVGKLVLELDRKPHAEYPLVALKEVRAGNVLQRGWDKLRLWLQ